MPLPLAPVMGIVLRYGAVAAASTIALRLASRKQEHKNAAFEASFNQIEDGLTLFRTEGENETQYHAHHGDWRRIWLGRHGFEIDSRVLARLRIRKITKE